MNLDYHTLKEYSNFKGRKLMIEDLIVKYDDNLRFSMNDSITESSFYDEDLYLINYREIYINE
jgi:hypothetical protein